MKHNERNFWLDSGLILILLFAVCTGLILWLPIPHPSTAVILGLHRGFWRFAHICSGLALVFGNVVHVIWHRNWLKALRKRPIASLPRKMRANRIVDRLIWVVFLAGCTFGALGWIFSNDTIGNLSGRLHVAFGLAWLLGVSVHLAFHRKWIGSAIKRTLCAKKMETGIILPGVISE